MNVLHALLALPAPLLLLNVLGTLVCGAILVSCICRLDAAKVTRGRVTFTQLMYLSFAFWAFGTLLDLTSGIVLPWHQSAVGLGIILHLLSTYSLWAGDDPVCDYWSRECGDAGTADC